MKEDRGFWQKALTRLRIWRGQAHYEDFSQYDELFEVLDKSSARPFPGEVACTLAHTKAWQEISSAKDVCLVLEDDAELVPGWSDQIDWPEDCSVLHLWPAFLGHTIPVDDQFSQLLEFSVEEVDEATPHNAVTVGYLITPQMARTLLEHKPIINIPTDEWLLNVMPKYATFFAYNQQRIINLGVERGSRRSLVREPTGHRFLSYLSQFEFYSKCTWIWTKITPTWLQHRFRKHRYHRNPWWR